MRLINTETFLLREFIGTIPKYAILSHRWQQDGEATLQQFRSELSQDSYEEDTLSSGIRKVLDFCRTSKAYALYWAWCDTVCIDKTNNVELSEAINSMYKWYQDSELCIVYLQDVDTADFIGTLYSSDWFTRGWTLQELIAPSQAVFFGPGWTYLEPKGNLLSALHEITGIPIDVLDKSRPATSCNVAERMSWAARRETSRPEDVAYCLLGLLDVNMELLYGEGALKAFQRLQIKILEEYDDESLLTWELDEEDLQDSLAKGKLQCFDSEASSIEFSASCVLTGILATKPRQFLRTSPPSLGDRYTPNTPPRCSSRGLEFIRDVRVFTHIKMKRTASGYEGEEEFGEHATVVLLPLPYGRSSQRSNIVLAEDLSSSPVKRYCRLVPLEDSMADCAEVLACAAYDERSDERLFVRISRPPASTMVYLETDTGEVVSAAYTSAQSSLPR